MWSQLTRTDKQYMTISISLLCLLVIWLSCEGDKRDEMVDYRPPYVVQLSSQDRAQLAEINDKLDSLMAAHRWAFDSK